MHPFVTVNVALRPLGGVFFIGGRTTSQTRKTRPYYQFMRFAASAAVNYTDLFNHGCAWSGSNLCYVID